VLLLIATLVVLGLVVPGALALFGRWETPKHFVADKSQPPWMRDTIRHWMLDSVEGGPYEWGTHVIAVKTVLNANTPDGPARVYAFRFTHGLTGSLAVLTHKPRLLAESGDWGLNQTHPPPGGCPPGWALQYLNGGTERIGKTVGYVYGRASPRVASVHVLYPNGSTTHSAVGNGYFLAWMKPSAARTNVTLIAENAAGRTVARLVILAARHISPTDRFAEGAGLAPGGGLLAAKSRSHYPCAP
jgi:hypothetical protein